MALPGAEILDINTSPPESVHWEEVEHVALTKAFLNHPEAFLKHLAD
jgi:predicted ATPase